MSSDQPTDDEELKRLKRELYRAETLAREVAKQREATNALWCVFVFFLLMFIVAVVAA